MYTFTVVIHIVKVLYFYHPLKCDNDGWGNLKKWQLNVGKM